jgi:multimeric flavodoxin WrbA
MKITILNGNPYADHVAFDNYLRDLSQHLELHHHTVNVFNLREMDIKHCIGCFSCWVKTPGKCITKDNSDGICRAYINSDLILFASPVIMGFTSALLKKTHEKLLPLVHPYLEFVQTEVRHLSRYEKYPLTALLLEKGNDTDEEDIKIISDIYRRDAVNFKTQFCFTKLIGDPLVEVADEIDGV